MKGSKRTPRLLVVDNELEICNFVKSFFELRGFEVATALNGDEGLARIEQGFVPDIVILDVMMRTDDEGIVYLPKFKKALPATRVLMITGVNDEKTIEAAKALGADDYITKPLVLEYLESTVLHKIRSINPLAK
jgi:DNA-binding response OmpR family regulator